MAETLAGLGADVQFTVVPADGHFLASLTSAGIGPLLDALGAARNAE